MKNKNLILLFILILSFSNNLKAQDSTNVINCNLELYGNKDVYFCENFFVFFEIEGKIYAPADPSKKTRSIVVPDNIPLDSTQINICIYYKESVYSFTSMASVLSKKNRHRWHIEIGRDPLTFSDEYYPEYFKVRKIKLYKSTGPVNVLRIPVSYDDEIKARLNQLNRSQENEK